MQTDFLSSSLNEECGVFGVLSRQTGNLGHMLYYGLYALQHRGQESCGVAVYDNDQLRLHKEMGLVNQVFSQKILDQFNGQIGIGHTRYSTTGGSMLDNAQPVIARTSIGAVSLAHNGNLINTEVLRKRLDKEGVFVHGDSDSHMMVQAIHLALRGQYSLEQAVKDALSECEGAFSVVVASGDTLIAIRDRHALRPLCYGRTESGAIVMASETCALDIVGATYERDLEPGEILIAKMDGTLRSDWLPGERSNRFCVFELVYFARPDSQIGGKSVYNYRMELGRKLALAGPKVEADLVIPVPDSGNVAAVGYSQASGIPYAEGLIKNRYVGRTFINPTQALREQGIKLKLNPLTDILDGKRVVVVDDSIVRGNTSKKLVQMLKACGVKEIHLRISSAQVKFPCFYGIDMSSPDQLLANQLESIEAIRSWLEVDSLAYLSVEDMRAVAQLSQRDWQPCMACFNNDYPAGVPEDLAVHAC